MSKWKWTKRICKIGFGVYLGVQVWRGVCYVNNTYNEFQQSLHPATYTALEVADDASAKYEQARDYIDSVVNDWDQLRKGKDEFKQSVTECVQNE